jgi:hypothetical protein
MRKVPVLGETRFLLPLKYAAVKVMNAFMREFATLRLWRPRHQLLAAILLLTVCPAASGQNPSAITPEFLFDEPKLPRELSVRWDCSSPETAPVNRLTSVRLFSMPTAIPLAPLGLDADDSQPEGPEADANGADDSRMQIVLGADNPYFDFRRRGDPGGVGFYKLYSQVMVYETPRSAMSVGLKAWAPAGLEADGMAAGPTHIYPNFAWLCDLGGGAALHGFVGQNLRAAAHWDDQLARSLQYGLALQSPSLAKEPDGTSGLHFFVEALGRYRYAGVATQRPARNCEFLPGLEWRLNQNWWFSGGYLFPVGTSAIDNHRVQLNFTWRF